MADSSKILNNLFVWGSAGASGSELAALSPDPSTHVVEGVQGGDKVHADIANSAWRCATVLGWSLIQAIKKGPVGKEIPQTPPGDSWDASLPTLDFSYSASDSDLDSVFAENLRKAIDAYIAFSRSYFSWKAAAWSSPQTITITDGSSAAGHSTVSDPIDGSAPITLTLPSEIDADITGSAADVWSTIDGMAITDIFEYSQGEITGKVLFAAHADEAELAWEVTVIKESSSSAEKALVFASGNSSQEGEELLADSDKLLYTPSSGKLKARQIDAPVQTGAFAICSTSSATQVKEISIPGFLNYAEGAKITVWFYYANSIDGPKLKINSGPELAIRRAGTLATASPLWGWGDNEFVSLVLRTPSGAQPIWEIQGRGAPAAQYGTCSTAAATRDKEVSLPGFILKDRSHIFVRFANANTVASPRLNVNGTGARAIYWRGANLGGTHGYDSWEAREILEFVYVDDVWQLANKQKNAWHAAEADEAAEADHAAEADEAAKLGSASVGAADTPIYLDAGEAKTGYRSAVYFIYNGSGRYVQQTQPVSVETLSFPSTQQIFYSGIITAEQYHPKSYMMQADLRVKLETEASMAEDTWYRISLDDLVKTVFSDYSELGAESHMSVIASAERYHLAFGPVTVVTHIQRKGNKEGYAYIGLDSKSGATASFSGFSVHISFMVNLN